MVFKRRDKPSRSQRLREAVLPSRGWRRSLEYIGLRLKRLPDTPHRIAMGFACGVFVAWTPLFGLHLVLAPVMAKLLRGNLLASIIGTFVGNPLTFPVMAAISLNIGRHILGHGVTGRDFSRIVDAFGQFVSGLWPSLLSLVGLGRPQWERLSSFFHDVFMPYLVGSIGPGLVTGAAAYLLLRPLAAAFQARRRERIAARQGRPAAEPAPADAPG